MMGKHRVINVCVFCGGKPSGHGFYKVIPGKTEIPVLRFCCTKCIVGYYSLPKSADKRLVKKFHTHSGKELTKRIGCMARTSPEPICETGLTSSSNSPALFDRILGRIKGGVL